MSQARENEIRELYRNCSEPSALPPTDEYGFIAKMHASLPENYSDSKMQWYMLIDRYGTDRKKFRSTIIKNHLLEKGIPLSLKSRIWQELLPIVHCPGYATLRTLGSKYDYQIHVDIQRTFRQHFLFLEEYGTGQGELFRVLSALANYDPSVGYCQGMSDICAVLLMYFTEQEAFEMYVALAARNRLRELFDSNLSKIPQVMKLQSALFSALIPQIQRHIANYAEELSLHGVCWYMTLFSRFSIRLVLRIWDFLFFYGFNVLIYFAAAILTYHEDVLLKMENDQLLQFIGKIGDMEIDEDVVVSIAVKYLEDMKYKYIG